MFERIDTCMWNLTCFVCCLCIFLWDRYIFSSSAFCNHCFRSQKKTNTRRIFVFTKKNKNYLFHSRFSVYLFISTYLFKQQQQLSGRDIICFPPNALFISGRDFVQSFESRHGRHGNSNLVMLFVSERNNHWRNKQKNKEIIYWLSTYIGVGSLRTLQPIE